MNIDEAIDIAQNVICDDVIGTYCTEIQKEEVNCSKNCENQDCYLVQAIETLINEYNNLKQIEEAHRIENGKLRKENKIKDEYLDLIQFMAVDYDGERKAKGLMELIDQLADYAVKGINCDTKSEIYFGKNILKENIDSHIPHID